VGQIMISCNHNLAKAAEIWLRAHKHI